MDCELFLINCESLLKKPASTAHFCRNPLETDGMFFAPAAVATSTATATED
jgi:hypothetical protein